MTYTVNVTREDGVWLADVPEVPGAHTFAYSLAGLTKSVREVIILMADLEDDAIVDIDLQIETDDESVSEAERLRHDREELEERLAQLMTETTTSAKGLVGKYSVRDTAKMLGLTPGRISQLTSR